jgi:hypothetical protein
MRRQDRQVRIALSHLIDHGGGLPQVTPVPDPWHAACLKRA